jgi:DNA-binding transcriptional LysR family regulator
MYFDIRQLRYAITVANHRSLYCAARALDVEQSTLSRNIVKLERIAGVKLFARSRAGTELTIAGARFIRSAREIVNSAEQMLNASRAAGQGRVGSLVLGFNSSVSGGHLRATMLAWMRANPDVLLEGVEANSDALLAGLNTGEVDLAILIGEATQNGFRRVSLWSEQILLALPIRHTLANRDIVHWTDLRDVEFALPAADPGPDIRDMLLGKFAMSGLRFAVRIQRTSRETVLSLLGEDGSYFSVVCEGSSGTLYPDVVYRPIHDERGPALTGYSGYWRPDNCNPPLQRFLAFVRQRYALSFPLSDASNEQQKGGESE